jgi:hypothetical protein
MEKQIKSKRRVTDHGEVFTAQREVNAMLDLVKPETERVESRFLEPACGNGNFLAEILRRKLAVVKKKYQKCLPDFEKFSVLAITSIYGIDILQDNVEACQKRLYQIWKQAYHSVCKHDAQTDCQKSVCFILKRNILCGDALSLMTVDDHCEKTSHPIIFSEWTFITGNLMKRRDFKLNALMNDSNGSDLDKDQMSLFADNTMDENNWTIDPETKEPTPKPIQEFEAKDYRKVWEDGE